MIITSTIIQEYHALSMICMILYPFFMVLTIDKTIKIGRIISNISFDSVIRHQHINIFTSDVIWVEMFIIGVENINHI